MMLVCGEVFKRYILNMPTAWIFDASNMLYGSPLHAGGAYALAQNAHVRGDFIYSSLKPRTQRRWTSSFTSSSSLPGMPPHLCRLRLCRIVMADRRALDGDRRRAADLLLQDGHVRSQAALVILQGLAEILRCIVCLRTGCGRRLKDVEEIDVVADQLAHSEHVDEETREAAIERAQDIDRAARPARPRRGRAVSEPFLGLTNAGPHRWS